MTESTTTDYKSWNCLKRLQKARNQVIHTAVKKTGHNKFGNYDYFQLQDFMPQATEAFFQVGLTPVFSISKEVVGKDESTGELLTEETAVLIIYNNDDRTDYVSFQSPTAEPNNSSNPIQNLGSKQTYMRRYLYMMALDMSETDIIDATSGQDQEPQKKAETPAKKPAQNVPAITEEQKQKIRNIYTESEIRSMTQKLKKRSLDDWNAIEAHRAIAFKEGEENAA